MTYLLFPFDSIMCILTFESYNYNNAEVKMRFIKRNGIAIREAEDLHLLDFIVSEREGFSCSMEYPAGYWDEMHMVFRFERQYGWFWMQTYLPTYFLISISWISFFLGTAAVPARILLGVSTMLTLLWNFQKVVSDLPRVSTVKAIDLWMLFAIVMIFMSIVELGVVGVLLSKKETKTSKEPVTLRKQRAKSAGSEPNYNLGARMYEWSESLVGRKQQIDSQTSNSVKANIVEQRDSESADIRLRCSCVCQISLPRAITAQMLDNASRILFPLVFLIFNLLYWGYISFSNDRQPTDHIKNDACIHYPMNG